MLRRKLLLGMLPLVGVVVVVGIIATGLLQKLGGAIEVILRENYASVVACQNIKEAADGMEMALFSQAHFSDAKTAKLFQQSDEALQKNLAIELHNITLPGEKELAEKLEGQSAVIQQQVEALAKEAVGSGGRVSLYENDLQPAIEQLKETAEQIKVLNQDNMLAANNHARKLSRGSAEGMVLAILLAVVIGLVAAYLVARGILQPVVALIESSRELGKGNLDQLVVVNSRDELGDLAKTFNHMAARLRVYRQSTTEQLLRAQQKTQAALAAFPDPIFIYSLQGAVELQNKAAEQFQLAKGGEATLPEGTLKLMEEVLRGGKDYLPTSFDQAIAVSLAKEERYYLPRILAMKEQESRLFGVVVVLQDVTRFRLADDVKTSLISTVSHELKTPLTSIQMAVYLLLEERVGALAPKQLELLLAARQNSERLLQMIDDLLDLAKFEQGTPFLALEATEPKLLITQAAEAARDLCEERGIRLEIEVAPDLTKVMAGRQQIGHVFSNLLSNAVKYSPVGSAIKLRASSEGEREVRFSVEDEGPGIPEQFYKRIFEKFFRMGDDKGGVGLGLAITREIVAAHGGRIGVKSDPDRGSEFFFFLPTA